jgi:hypothetical protein
MQRVRDQQSRVFSLQMSQWDPNKWAEDWATEGASGELEPSGSGFAVLGDQTKTQRVQGCANSAAHPVPSWSGASLLDSSRQ